MVLEGGPFPHRSRDQGTVKRQDRAGPDWKALRVRSCLRALGPRNRSEALLFFGGTRVKPMETREKCDPFAAPKLLAATALARGPVILSAGG